MAKPGPMVHLRPKGGSAMLASLSLKAVWYRHLFQHERGRECLHLQRRDLYRISCLRRFSMRR